MLLLGHSAGAYLAALYAAEHPDSTAGIVLLNPGPPLIPELMQQFGVAMGARRTLADDEERRAIEESAEFAAHQRAALERHQLNTFIPFFRDRATVEQVSLGFTDITSGNAQKAPERMMGSLGSLEPMRRFASIGCPTLVVHSRAGPDPRGVEPCPRRRDPGCSPRGRERRKPLPDDRGRRPAAQRRRAVAQEVRRLNDERADAHLGAFAQPRSNRSRFMTLSHAATKSRDELLLRVVAGVDLGERPEHRVRPEDQVDAAGRPPQRRRSSRSRPSNVSSASDVAAHAVPRSSRLTKKSLRQRLRACR